MTTIDVANLPFERTYVCEDGTTINLKEFLGSFEPSVEALAAAGRIKANDSFGFAMAEPMLTGYTLKGSWNNPSALGWFVGGWGLDKDRYIANALRKMRAMVRTGNESTLAMRLDEHARFQDVVRSVEDDGSFLWGDYPWGGAVSMGFGEMWLDGAVSCLSEVQDHAATSEILTLIAEPILKGNGLLTDD